MKIFKILTISFCIMIMLSQNVFALGNILTMGEEWENIGQGHTNTTMDTGKIKSLSDRIYNMLLAIAVAAAIIVGAILGIQFMTAGINKRVEVQRSLFPYLISCVVVFGSLGIWKLVVTILKSF